MPTLILPPPIFPNFSSVGISTDVDSIILSAPQTKITSTDFMVNDSIVILNDGDLGPGVTRSNGLSGFEVFRQNSTNYQVVFDEASDLLKAGFKNNIKTVPTLGTFNINDILGWDGSNLSAVPNNAFLKLINQPLSTLSIPTFESLNINSRTLILGQPLTFPATYGLSGNVLTTDGAGNLSWQLPAGGLDNTYNVTTTSSLNYTITNTDEIINWTGAANGQMILPSVSSFGISNGRSLIIQCRSAFDVSIIPTIGDLIGGTSSSMVLSDMYDRICLVSDGIDNWIIT